MKAQQIVMSIRLSERWSRLDHEMLRALAVYLYSFYTFLRLADSATKFGWALGTINDSEDIYMLLLEIPQGEDPNSEPSLPTEEELDFQMDSYEELDGNEDDSGRDPENGGLGDGDLDPDPELLD